jgi:hypothetical protein
MPKKDWKAAYDGVRCAIKHGTGELMPPYLHHAALRKVDAEYEHLLWSACLDHCGIDEEPLPCLRSGLKIEKLPCYHRFRYCYLICNNST